MRYTNEMCEDSNPTQGAWIREKEFAEAREKLQHEQDMAMRASGLMAQQQMSAYGGSRGLAGSNGPALKRNPEIVVAVNELNTLACNLMNVLVDLEKRLQPVMRSAPPETKQANGNVDQGSRTQLGSMVYQASHTIDLAVNRVRDLLDRLEL